MGNLLFIDSDDINGLSEALIDALERRGITFSNNENCNDMGCSHESVSHCGSYGCGYQPPSLCGNPLKSGIYKPRMNRWRC